MHDSHVFALNPITIVFCSKTKYRRGRFYQRGTRQYRNPVVAPTIPSIGNARNRGISIPVVSHLSFVGIFLFERFFVHNFEPSRPTVNDV